MPKASRIIATEAQINLRLLSDYNKYEGNLEFNTKDSKGQTVLVSISLINDMVTIKTPESHIDDELYQKLNNTLDQSYFLDEESTKEIFAMFREMHEAADRVLSLIKYHLKHYSIPETLGSYKSMKWGNSLETLHQVRGIYYGDLTTVLDSFSYRRIDAEWQGFVQSALDAKIEPLLAMRHLHRAKHEPHPHHKWIDATIAAELAVKEILIRNSPFLAEILLEVPSPPLSKLYGKLSAHYLGARSPYVSKLQDGQTIRNELVHRPASKKIDAQKANDYVEMVSDAIFHLLSLVYPKDMLIRNSAPGVITPDESQKS